MRTQKILLKKNVNGQCLEDHLMALSKDLMEEKENGYQGKRFALISKWVKEE